MSNIDINQLNKNAYDLRGTLYVDPNSSFLIIEQNGTPARPYATIQQAIDYASSQSQASWHIKLSFGSHSGDIQIPSNKNFVFEGVARRGPINITGNITWTVTGNLVSKLGFRNVNINSINILDDVVPAANATLVFENCQVQLISALGSSYITCSMGSSSIAAFDQLTYYILQDPIHAAVQSNINILNGSLLLENIHLDNTSISAGTIHANSCYFANIYIYGITSEFNSCIWASGCNIQFVNNAGTIYFDDLSKYNFDNTGCYITNGSFIIRSAVGASSGISADTHRSLRQLIHFIDEGPADGFVSGAYKEILPFGDPFPTSVVWYEDSSKVKKIVEQNIVRNSKKVPISIVWNIYNVDGVSILHSISDAIIYANNIFETSRIRTII